MSCRLLAVLGLWQRGECGLCVLHRLRKKKKKINLGLIIKKKSACCITQLGLTYLHWVQAFGEDVSVFPWVVLWAFSYNLTRPLCHSGLRNYKPTITTTTEPNCHNYQCDITISFSTKWVPVRLSQCVHHPLSRRRGVPASNTLPQHRQCEKDCSEPD